MTEREAGSGNEAWHDRIIGDRLAVDQEFGQRIRDSELSNQSWELVMTAAEFEIDRADDPRHAQLVMDLDKLDGVLPAIANIEESQGRGRQSNRGLLDRLIELVSSGGRGGRYRAEAEQLADEYARALQERLEETGQWQYIVELAAENGR